MKIQVDAAVLGVSEIYPSQRAGVWRFVRDWLSALLRREDVEITLVSNGRAQWNDLALEQALKRDRDFGNARYLRRAGSIPMLRGCLEFSARGVFALRDRGVLAERGVVAGLSLLQLGLTSRVDRSAGSVFHSPFHSLPASLPESVTGSITIHDMIPILFPQWCGDTSQFRRMVAGLDPLRHQVVTDSISTKDDFIRITGFPSERVEVVYPGISDRFHPLEADRAKALALEAGVPPGRFLLAVGTLEPRKNLPELLFAFGRLASKPEFQDLRLVLTGARGWKTEIFDATIAKLDPAVRNRVVATGFLRDEQLLALYSACEVFVFPSLYEGFGFPILEAMACGSAVVAMDNSSQPEVVGEAGVLCKSPSAESIATTLEELLLDPVRLAKLREQGPAQARSFTWERCAGQYVDLWKRMGSFAP